MQQTSASRSPDSRESFTSWRAKWRLPATINIKHQSQVTTHAQRHQSQVTYSNIMHQSQVTYSNIKHQLKFTKNNAANFFWNLNIKTCLEWSTDCDLLCWVSVELSADCDDTSDNLLPTVTHTYHLSCNTAELMYCQQLLVPHSVQIIDIVMS